MLYTRYYVLLLIPFCAAPLHSHNIFNTNAADISYVFSPGTNESEAIASKYVIGGTFVGSTGEQITASKTYINVLPTSVKAPTYCEILLKDKNLSSWNMASLYQKICGFFTKQRAKKRDSITITESNNHYSLDGHSFDLRKYTAGQNGDITRLSGLIAKRDTILYGASRGAAAIFNYLGTTQDTSHVKAAILEGVFDSLEHVIEKSYGLMTIPMKFLIRMVTSHNFEGIQPIKLVEKISKNIPLLLVTSRKDKTVPFECTWNLYTALRMSGHYKVHLLVLDHSSHPCYCNDNVDDASKYEAVVHAFYKAYQLPHNAKLAEKGFKDFIATQPHIEEISAHVIEHDYVYKPCAYKETLDMLLPMARVPYI